jgi:hypothetical protein
MINISHKSQFKFQQLQLEFLLKDLNSDADKWSGPPTTDNSGGLIVFKKVTPRSVRILPSIRTEFNPKEPTTKP